MKKSLVYLKNGKGIRMDDTVLNRIKAKLRGFTFIAKVDWSATVEVKGKKL